MNNKEQEKKRIREILTDPLKKNDSGEEAKKKLDRHIGFQREKDKFGSYVYLYSATKDGKFRPTKEIICYEGPPGTGKTTWVQTLSRAMGRGEPQIVPCAGLKEFKNYS